MKHAHDIHGNSSAGNTCKVDNRAKLGISFVTTLRSSNFDGGWDAVSIHLPCVAHRCNDIVGQICKSFSCARADHWGTVRDASGNSKHNI